MHASDNRVCRSTRDGMFRFICILSSTAMATKIDLIGKLQCTSTIN